MHLHEILNEQLQNAANLFRCPLRILETGTIRGEADNYASDDGWSTLCFAAWSRKDGGWTESVDLDISVAKRVLEANGVEPTEVLLHRAHSVDFLADCLVEQGHQAPKIHLAYLDSDNDPTLILCEYLLVTRLMPSGGIVMVDDVNLAADSGSLKGHAVVPWLEKHEQPYTIVQRQGQGYRTGVLITRVP